MIKNKLLKLNLQFFAEPEVSLTKEERNEDRFFEFQSLIDQIREQIPEDNRALTSSGFSALETIHRGILEDNERMLGEVDFLKKRQLALLEENNRLFKQIPSRYEDYRTSPNPHIVSDNTDNPEPAEKVLSVDDLLFGKDDN